ncbi:MAG: iron-containing alcohol dehydrogenase [Erysipelotrichaceae bacterium]|nr:iron-containing alcohol dehydrogenase [Erysipelotrichaceae bacterium]
MRYYDPVELYQEENCVLNHQDRIAALGKKALIVTGRSSAGNGSLSDLLKAFENNSIAYEIFNEVEENPSVETVMKIRDKFRDSGIEFVVGLGGGSAMDAAKAVAIMLYFRDEEADFLYRTPDKVLSLPILTVPTTCGTGSEVTPSAVLTLHDRNTKNSISHKIYPTLSLVDARYIRTLPLQVLRNSAIDALAHLIESHVNSTSTAYSRLFTVRGLELFACVKDVLKGTERSREDDERLMLLATLGGFAIAQTGTSLPHGASYPVTYRRHMPHGKAVGYFQYGYLLNADESIRNEVLKLTGFETAEDLRDFIVEVCKIEPLDEEILEISLRELLSNQKMLRVCPFETSEENIRKMIFSLGAGH